MMAEDRDRISKREALAAVLAAERTTAPGCDWLIVLTPADPADPDRDARLVAPGLTTYFDEGTCARVWAWSEGPDGADDLTGTLVDFSMSGLSQLMLEQVQFTLTLPDGEKVTGTLRELVDAVRSELSRCYCAMTAEARSKRIVAEMLAEAPEAEAPKPVKAVTQ